MAGLEKDNTKSQKPFSDVLFTEGCMQGAVQRMKLQGLSEQVLPS